MSTHTSFDSNRRPLVLIWELTQACDLACKHCRAEANDCRHPDELTTAEGKQLLSDISEFGDGQLVVLSGGDPLYRDDLIELIEHGRSAGLNMTLTPSGTSSLTEDRVRELAATGLKRMALSIDGPTPARHDEFRQEQGSFEQTMQAAKAANDAGLPLQINTTVCGETVDGLREMRSLVESLEAVLWSVFFLVPIGRGEVLESIEPAKAEAVMRWLYQVSKSAPFGIKTTEAPHYRRVSAQLSPASSERRNGTQRRSGIIAGDGFAFVSHTGELYPSGFLPQSAGNVRSHDIVSLYRDAELFTSLRDRSSLHGKCGACEFKHLCGGSRSRAYAHTGDPFASDPLCPYIPESYEAGSRGKTTPSD